MVLKVYLLNCDHAIHCCSPGFNHSIHSATYLDENVPCDGEFDAD